MGDTTIYLIRHSVRLSKDYIEKNNTSQDNLILSEKSCLSPEGEKRAEILSNELELQNLDVVYASNCVRTLQTAKYILEKQNLRVAIDERFDERRAGKPNNTSIKDWWVRQYLDENFKTEGGECQRDVRERFTEAFYEVLNENKGKRIAIFSHGYAITFFIMTWCTFEYQGERDYMKFTFNGKEIFCKKINAPEVFKLTFDDNNEIKDIQTIEFEDLPYRSGMGKLY